MLSARRAKPVAVDAARSARALVSVSVALGVCARLSLQHQQCRRWRELPAVCVSAFQRFGRSNYLDGDGAQILESVTVSDQCNGRVARRRGSALHFEADAPRARLAAAAAAISDGAARPGRVPQPAHQDSRENAQHGHHLCHLQAMCVLRHVHALSPCEAASFFSECVTPPFHRAQASPASKRRRRRRPNSSPMLAASCVLSAAIRRSRA